MNHDHGARGVSGGFGIPQPELGTLCEVCGIFPGLPHQCQADGRSHGHGMVHVRNENGHILKWVCCACYDGSTP